MFRRLTLGLFNFNEKSPFKCFLALFFLAGIPIYFALGDSRWGCGLYPETSEVFYVSDYSGALTRETEDYIAQAARRLEDATTVQIAVTVMPTINGDILESYATELFNYWKLGQQDKNNGLMILFVQDVAKVRLEVGAGLEESITDAEAGRILDDYAVEPKSKGEWNRAAANTFTALANKVYAISGKEPDSSLRFIDKEVSGSKEGGPADAVFTDDPAASPNGGLFLFLKLLCGAVGGFFFWLLTIAINATIVESIDPAAYRRSSWAKYSGSGGSSGSRRSSGRSSYSSGSYSGGRSRSSGGGGHSRGGGASR
ncbi:MAG: TPM domain-containing protein [Succinimonas sp.]|nr:TPM domain-containing protein [Succinimonas sp.]